MGAGVLTDSFPRHGTALCAEGVPLREIADAVGTPAFVYSAGHVRARYRMLAGALARTNARIHYSLKANACGALLGVLRGEGSGVDVVSGGELYLALRAGFAPGDVVFGGVGKTAAEIEAGVRAQVRMLNIESYAELELASAIASACGLSVRIGLRVNPEVAVESAHHYTKTGERGHKFGIPFDEVETVARRALELPNVHLVGIGMHVGSQLLSLEAHRTGAERLVGLVDRVRALGARSLELLDLGGGLPVRYDREGDFDLDGFAAIVADVVGRTGLQVVLEPGRFLVANAGVLLARVLYRKRSGGSECIVTDTGMTELLRPSHYGAYHAIEAVEADLDRGNGIVADIVGPVCESGDFLALQREVPDLAPGDLLAVRSVGAYGFVMASHYNARPRAAEVIVDGDRWAVATRRETHADLVRQQEDPLQWRVTE